MPYSIGNRIKQLRQDKGKTQDEIGKALGVGNSTISLYESDTRRPDANTILRLAEFFGVSTDYLLGKNPDGRPSANLSQTTTHKTVPIPILGRIKAGLPLLSEANFEGEIEVSTDIKADFALRVSGDSMSWAGIADGDIAILKQVSSPTHGTVVAAVEEDSWDATLKFYVKANGHAVLKAANPEYKDIPITEKHKIIGQLVSLSKNPPVLNDYLAHLMYKGLTDKKWELAVEIAQQAGLDGESVANLISVFVKSVRHVAK
ncbi:MAG: helix-turn-helix domain-containing protein [Thermaerobacter sp.]|nr:helix-turn-helix domain-containing protein [Thermaerobacter sp.]